MKSNLNMEAITNGLLAVQRLKQLYNPAQREDGLPVSETLQPDKLTLLKDTLTAIMDFMPATRGGSLNAAFRLGSHYSSTYRGIKHHFRDMSQGYNTGGTGMAQLMKTLKVIAPVFTSREKVYMDKVIKIFDILVS